MLSRRYATDHGGGREGSVGKGVSRNWKPRSRAHRLRPFSGPYARCGLPKVAIRASQRAARSVVLLGGVRMATAMDLTIST